MKVLGTRRGEWPARRAVSSWFVAVVLLGAPVAGCDQPFQPFQENTNASFSMFGYLDLKADTQWVRVMPVRQNLFLAPEPIDAVVTLEHLGSGRIVTLNDSLFRFVDPRLGGVAHAYNFWTTERLEPGESYRLRAVRSDGASTTATVVMPPDLEFSLLNDIRAGRESALLQVRAERLVFVEVLYAMQDAIAGEAVGSVAVRDHWTFSTGDPGTFGIAVSGDTLFRAGLRDARRQEIRIVVARSDWPYHPGLPDLDVILPDRMPSNVENGVGFVGGLASWTVPFHRCRELAPRADRDHACAISYNGQTASIVGRVIREPCGDPHILADIHLTERFAGGGAILRTWKTGWDGRYRFEGIEPGADLVLDLGPGTSEVHLPRLAPGERHVGNNISVPGGC
jgi:hypothetical protein